MTKTHLTKSLIICIAVFIAILIPTSVVVPSQFKTSAIVTTLGIDIKNDHDIDVTAQFLKPHPIQGFEQKFQQINGTGRDINTCFEQIEMKLGKMLLLAHCSSIVISDDVCRRHNILKLLDGILRDNELGTNAIVIHSQGSAKDILSASANQELISQDLLVDIASYDNKQLYSPNIDLYSLFHYSMTPSATAIIPSLYIQKSTPKLDSQSTQQDSATDSPTPTHNITNLGDVCVFTHGNFVGVFDYQQMSGFNWLDNDTINNTFLLHDYHTPDIPNATVQMKNIGQKVRFRADISHSIPTINIDIFTTANVVMLNTETDQVLPTNIDSIDPLLQQLFSNLVTTQVNHSLQFARQHHFDKLNFYNMLDRANHREWLQYIQSLPNQSNYMDNIRVIVHPHLIKKS